MNFIPVPNAVKPREPTNTNSCLLNVTTRLMAQEASRDYNILGNISTIEKKKKKDDSIASKIAPIFLCGITWNCSCTSARFHW